MTSEEKDTSSTTRNEVEAGSMDSTSKRVGSTSPDVAPIPKKRKLLTKIDLHVLPILCLMYMMAFLDRVNIGNAVIFGLSKELKLEGSQYNVALCIFFIPYIIFELPANALLKKIKPHLFLSVCMFMFGLITICQGFVKSYSGLLATRFFLGFFETGVFPACFYLLAMWYKRAESQKRFSFFFLSTALAGAFGGLLASGIGDLNGHRGKLAWRWIFIIEGAITCAVSIIGYFLIPDFPEDVKWLTADEKTWVKARLQEDVGKSGRTTRPVNIKDMMIIFKEPMFIINAIMYFAFLVPAYGFAYFAPTIVKGLHYSAIGTQLHTVPIWVVAWVAAMLVAFASDYMKHRFLFVVVPSTISIIGFIMLLTIHDNLHAQYAALFLALGGSFSATPMAICWFNTNLAGHNRRAVGTAFQIAFGNFGGVASVFLFETKDAPKYVTGYATCLAMVIVAMIAAVAYLIVLTRANKLREEGKGGIVIDSDDEEAENVGDLRQSHRYSR